MLLYLFEDLACGLGPDEWLWIGLGVFQGFHGSPLKSGDALEKRRGVPLTRELA